MGTPSTPLPALAVLAQIVLLPCVASPSPVFPQTLHATGTPSTPAAALELLLALGALPRHVNLSLLQANVPTEFPATVEQVARQLAASPPPDPDKVRTWCAVPWFNTMHLLQHHDGAYQCMVCHAIVEGGCLVCPAPRPEWEGSTAAPLPAGKKEQWQKKKKRNNERLSMNRFPCLLFWEGFLPGMRSLPTRSIMKGFPGWRGHSFLFGWRCLLTSWAIACMYLVGVGSTSSSCPAACV